MGAAIGRPRRFSSAFLKGEIVKVKAYRNEARAIQYNNVDFKPPKVSHSSFPYKVCTSLYIVFCQYDNALYFRCAYVYALFF